jgi:hypothetical protein
LEFKVTKETYFEICETLGNEPIEEEIPVDFEDFPPELQLAFDIYNTLQDSWDYMGGNYIGKSYSSIKDILEIFDIERTEMAFYLGLLSIIDNTRKELINSKKPAK